MVLSEEVVVGAADGAVDGGTASGVRAGESSEPPPLATTTAARTAASANIANVPSSSAFCVRLNPALRAGGGVTGSEGCDAYAGRGSGVANCRVGGGPTGGGSGAATGAIRPDDAASAARASSPADPNRSAGFFAMPFATTSSNADGTPGRMMLGRGGGENRCALITCRRSPASNGARPVRLSNSRHASE